MNVSHTLFSEFAKSDPSPYSSRLNTPTPPPRRIKSGGPLENFGGAALDRLRAMRRGQLPTAANAAESQRLATGMSQEQQSRYATQQRANLDREKQDRKEAKERERKLRLLSRGPGFAGLDTGEFDQERSDMTEGKITSPGQDLQTQIREIRQEPVTEDDPMLQRTGTNTGTTPPDTQTEGQPPTEQPVEGQTPPPSQQTGRRPLFAGQKGGIKIPGVGAAAKYTMQNPRATFGMLGMPAAYAMFGGALEAGLNLAGRGYDAIRQRQQNPTITRSLTEYNPELSILLKTQEGMRASRDIRSTEVIRYAYG